MIGSSRSLNVREVLTADGDPLQVTAAFTEIKPERRLRDDDD